MAYLSKQLQDDNLKKKLLRRQHIRSITVTLRLRLWTLLGLITLFFLNYIYLII